MQKQAYSRKFRIRRFHTFLRDSTLVVCENYTGLVRVLNTGTGEVKNKMQFPADTKLGCSSDGSLVAAALENDSVELWDTEKREIKHVFPCRWRATLHSIQLSSNGEVMAVVHDDGLRERTFSGVPWSANPVFFSPNNQVMALVNDKAIFWGHEARFWDNHEKASKRIPGFSLHYSSRIVFSRDGKSAALVKSDSAIRLDKPGQGEEIRVLKGHSDNVTSVAFSPISPLLASASRDHRVILWDTEKGEKLCILKAYSDAVKDVAFSPNGEYVATASADGMVGLWNVSRWKNRKDQEQSS